MAEIHISAIVRMPPRKASLADYSERVALVVLSKLTGVSATSEEDQVGWRNNVWPVYGNDARNHGVGFTGL